MYEGNRYTASAFLVVFVILLFVAGYFTSHYSRHGQIVAIDYDVVEVVDEYGDDWFLKAEGYEVGDAVKIRIFNNFTDNTLKDDEIVGIN